DVLRESLERQHDAMAQHIEREVLYVLTGDVPAAPEIGQRATGEDEVDRSARARAVADVLGDVADAVFGRLPRRGGQPDDVFEERALHFRRRAVDLIREEKVGEHRAERCLEVAGALVVDPCADEVGGNQVGRELDPLEVSGDRLRDRLYREGLSETGYPFDKQVATREETDHEALDQVVLPDDHLLDLE